MHVKETWVLCNKGHRIVPIPIFLHATTAPWELINTHFLFTLSKHEFYGSHVSLDERNGEFCYNNMAS